MPAALSLWDFVLLSAEAPPKDSNGDSWDGFGGLPDLVVGVRMGTTLNGPKRTASSTVKSDTLSGVWNTVLFTFTWDNMQSDLFSGHYTLTISLVDEDISLHDLIARCEYITPIELASTMKYFVTGGVRECERDGAKIRYEIRPHM